MCRGVSLFKPTNAYQSQSHFYQSKGFKEGRVVVDGRKLPVVYSGVLFQNHLEQRNRGNVTKTNSIRNTYIINIQVLR